MQLKDTFPVLGNVNSNKTNFFFLFISFVIQTWAIIGYAVLVNADLMVIFNYPIYFLKIRKEKLKVNNIKPTLS